MNILINYHSLLILKQSTHLAGKEITLGKDMLEWGLVLA